MTLDTIASDIKNNHVYLYRIIISFIRYIEYMYTNIKHIKTAWT